MYNITYIYKNRGPVQDPGPTPGSGPLTTWTWTYKNGSGTTFDWPGPSDPWGRSGPDPGPQGPGPDPGPQGPGPDLGQSTHDAWLHRPVLL
jgi:hypothetical protein